MNNFKTIVVDVNDLAQALLDAQRFGVRVWIVSSDAPASVSVSGLPIEVDALLAFWGYTPLGEAVGGVRCPTCKQPGAMPGTTAGHKDGCPEAFATEPTLTKICGWCPDAREKTEAAVARGEEVTHGMCPACQQKFEGGQS